MTGDAPTFLPFRSVALTGRDEFRRYVGAMGPMLDHRYGQELALASRQDEFRMEGINPVLAMRTSFVVSARGGEVLEDGRRLPVWRETVVCERTAMINRERALAHFLGSRGLLGRKPKVRVVSDPSAFTCWLENEVTGVELTPVENPRGASGAEVDLLISVEALLGRDLILAVNEAAASLAPGGAWVFTTPFHYGEDVSRSGSEPTIAWDVLSLIRDSGLAGEAHLYWNQEFGYLGPYNFIFLASRS